MYKVVDWPFLSLDTENYGLKARKDNIYCA